MGCGRSLFSELEVSAGTAAASGEAVGISETDRQVVPGAGTWGGGGGGGGDTTGHQESKQRQSQCLPAWRGDCNWPKGLPTGPHSTYFCQSHRQGDQAAIAALS